MACLWGLRAAVYERNIIRDRPGQVFVGPLKSERFRHHLEVTLPRGNDSTGCVQHVSVFTGPIAIVHTLSVSPTIKGLKDGELRATVPILFGTLPPEKKVIEFNI